MKNVTCFHELLCVGFVKMLQYDPSTIFLLPVYSYNNIQFLKCRDRIDLFTLLAKKNSLASTWTLHLLIYTVYVGFYFKELNSQLVYPSSLKTHSQSHVTLSLICTQGLGCMRCDTLYMWLRSHMIEVKDFFFFFAASPSRSWSWCYL